MSHRTDNIISFSKAKMNADHLKGKDVYKKKFHDFQKNFIQSFLVALKNKDPYTYEHSLRVAKNTLLLGRDYDLTSEELYRLEISALCHDIGKIGIPDAILLKPSRLNEYEYNIMKKHPEKACQIFSSIKSLDEMGRDIRHHHERYNGTGYPDGLKEDEIPLNSRIILIADTFDAITSTRPYREKLLDRIAFDELDEFAGTQFDPTLTQLFIKTMQKKNKISLTIMNERKKTG